MEQSPRLSLSYVAPSQAQKHVTVNETFRRLDALTQAAVRSRTETDEPADPDEGDAYVIPSGASGAAWDAFDAGDLAAFQDGAWARMAPFEGLRVWVADADEFVIYDGAAWGVLTGGVGSSETAAKFGVNTAADVTNKLSVKADAALFNHDDVTPGSGDMRVIVNKAAAGDTASVLFQTGASGRAEFGLAGDDDFHVKVSPDNFATSFSAILIDKDTGHVALGASAPQEKLHVQGGYLLFDNGYGFYAKDVGGTGQRMFHLGGDNHCSINANTLTNDIRFFANGQQMRLYSGGGLVVGGPAGGNKGAGAVNAVAVYDDNTLLTCYVFDQALDGAVDAAKWDAKVPDRRIVEEDRETGAVIREETVARRHEPMRKFAARIGTAHDPLSLDGYARHWREKRHLTSMPNEAAFDPEKGMAAGEWIQRLVETTEIQAVLIEALNQRLKAVEEGPGGVKRV